MDYIEREILWGESSIIYTDKNSVEQVVEFPAKLFIIMDYEEAVSSQQEQQQDTKTTSSNTIIVTPNKAVEVKTNTVDVSKSSSKQEEFIVFPDNVIASATVQAEAEPILDVSVKVEKEIEKPIEQKVAENKSIENKPIENKPIENKTEASINAKPAQNTETSPKSGYYYIQVSSIKIKKTISEVREYLQVLQEDNLVMLQKGQYYVYMVGPFSTKEDATEKLEHYQKQIRDAFVVKF
jgi:cell division septation protein DedD